MTELADLFAVAARIVVIERTFMYAVQMCKADIRLEILRPVEGRTNREPPAVSIRNKCRTGLWVADGRSFIGNTTAQRPEGIHAKVVTYRIKVGIDPIILDVGKIVENSGQKANFICGDSSTLSKCLKCPTDFGTEFRSIGFETLEARPICPTEGSVKAEVVVDIPCCIEHCPSRTRNRNRSVIVTAQAAHSTRTACFERSVCFVLRFRTIRHTKSNVLDGCPHHAEIESPGKSICRVFIMESAVLSHIDADAKLRIHIPELPAVYYSRDFGRSVSGLKRS